MAGPDSDRPALRHIELSETDFTDDLKRIDVPTLVMHGDDDKVLLVGASAMLSSELIRHAQLKVYKGFVARNGHDASRPDQRRSPRVHQALARWRRARKGKSTTAGTDSWHDAA